MKTNVHQLKQHLEKISRDWISHGLPSRQVLESTADELEEWKQSHAVSGIWAKQPLMLTATLDDGIGQGISIIERYAEVVGLEVQRIGLLQKPETIVDRCHSLQPLILGLTVLQLDSDEDLAQVGHQRPPNTCIIAGGPVFKFDPDMADRCKVDYVALDLAYFIDYLLKMASQWPGVQ